MCQQTVHIHIDIAIMGRKCLSLLFTDLPKGATILSTTGTPITLSFPANEKALIHVKGTDENGADVTSSLTGVTATSDNPNLVVASTPDPMAFFVAGVAAAPTSGIVKFEDSAGDTVVANITTTAAGPPPVVTLSLTADPPIAQ